MERTVPFPETGEESPYVGITDTFDATYVVAMQPDGSYVLTKVVKGTFVTRAGVSQPNPPAVDCDTAASRQTGGVTGTFYGTMSVTVPANSGFNAFASCGAPCSPHTTVTSATSAQNDAFVAAFFRAGESGTLTGYSFVYDARGERPHGAGLHRHRHRQHHWLSTRD